MGGAWGGVVYHDAAYGAEVHHFGPQGLPLDTVRFPETTVAGEPITTYASNSVGAAAYRQLAREVLARCPAE